MSAATCGNHSQAPDSLRHPGYARYEDNRAYAGLSNAINVAARIAAMTVRCCNWLPSASGFPVLP